jgi:UDP-N-acetylglucosamine 2-epimerase
MRILVVMGTRPEAIKLAPVVAALRRRKNLETIVCATAQHRELLDQVLAPFKLRPDFDLNLMRAGQTPTSVARRVLVALNPFLKSLAPDMVVVQGDTTTAAAAALAATRRGIPIAHVEAGLRSFNLNDPFPEERNRVVIDLLASLLFPPTPVARTNLAREKLAGRTVVTTGNTVVDALRQAGRSGPNKARAREVLVTLHRREIFGAPLRKIYAALLGLVERHPDFVFLYPVHPNPAVLRTANQVLRHPRIKLLKPQGYPEFLRLLRRCLFVITDSGGVQEEAVCLKTPVLIVRENTERPEVLSSGAGRLTGLDPVKLSRWASRLLSDAALRRRMGAARNPYGDGRAAERVAAGIAFWFKLGRKPADWNP